MENLKSKNAVIGNTIVSYNFLAKLSAIQLHNFYNDIASIYDITSAQMMLLNAIDAGNRKADYVLTITSR